jgi:hypothetical protein
LGRFLCPPAYYNAMLDIIRGIELWKSEFGDSSVCGRLNPTGPSRFEARSEFSGLSPTEFRYPRPNETLSIKRCVGLCSFLWNRMPLSAMLKRGQDQKSRLLEQRRLPECFSIKTPETFPMHGNAVVLDWISAFFRPFTTRARQATLFQGAA